MALPLDTSFLFNPVQRVQCVIVADTSGSMSGPPIDQLNRGLDILHHEVLSDPIAAKCAEICLITFGGSVQVRQAFATIDQINTLSGLQASGGTPMGAAITQTLQLIEQRQQTYQANGVTCLKPWVWLITDGQATDNIDGPGQQLRDAATRGDIIVFPIGVDGANFDALAKLSNVPPLKLDGVKFPELFKFVAKTMRAATRSRPGDRVRVDEPTEVGRFVTVNT